MPITQVSNGPRMGHLNQYLSQLSIEYRPTNGRFIADELLPVVSVSKESDAYATWDKSQRARVDRTDGRDTLRADGARARQFKYGWTNDSYIAEEWAGDFYVTDRELANSDEGLDIVLAHSNGVYDAIIRDREIRVASTLMSTNTYASTNKTTLAGANQWNNASFASQGTVKFSQIKSDVMTGRRAIIQQTMGAIPNVVVLPDAVATVMENDFALMDALKHNGAIPNLVSDGMPLAHGNTFFGMRILRPSMVYDTSIEGETAALTDVWGKSVLMAVVGPAAQRTITLALQFRVKPFGMQNSWRDEATTSNYYRVGMIQAEKVVASSAGYLINAAIA